MGGGGGSGGISAVEAKLLAERVSSMQKEHEAALARSKSEASRAQVRPHCCLAAQIGC